MVASAAAVAVLVLLALPRQLQWADRAAAELLHLFVVVGLQRRPCLVGRIDGIGLPRGRPRVCRQSCCSHRIPAAPPRHGCHARRRTCAGSTPSAHPSQQPVNLLHNDVCATAGDLAVAVPPVCQALAIGRPVNLKLLFSDDKELRSATIVVVELRHGVATVWLVLGLPRRAPAQRWPRAPAAAPSPWLQPLPGRSWHAPLLPGQDRHRLPSCCCGRPRAPLCTPAHARERYIRKR